MAPTRVLVVSNMIPGKGAPYYGAFVAAHVRELQRDPRLQVEFVGIDDPQKGRARALVKYGRLFAALAERLCAFRPEVVHYHYALPTALPAPLVSRLCGTPYVVTLHGGDFYQMRARLVGGRMLLTRVLCDATEIIAVSEALARDVAASLPHAHPPVTVVNMGVDLARFAAVRAGPLHRLAYVGQLIRRKGVDIALQALAELRRTAPACTLTVIGDGPEARALEALAARLGIAPAVTFTGGLPPERVAAALDGHGVLLVPSRAEPLGLVALEGMAAGLIVVTSGAGGLAELVRADNGVTVGDHNGAAWARCLAGLQSMPASDQERLRAAARRTAAAHAVSEKVAAVSRILRAAAGRGD
ncbi:MAG: glycosyltransferase [Deltaproteobacteria bacterium]|nr:glycosyltransferase [Deltaproteobacteria bacterium]